MSLFETVSAFNACLTATTELNLEVCSSFHTFGSCRNVFGPDSFVNSNVVKFIIV